MRKTVHKWFWVWNFDKEEQWLNDMAAKGLALVAVTIGTYTFEEGAPGDYKVRLELLDNLPQHPESGQYIRFLEETGAEYLGSVGRWVYFRRKTADGPFELYSDNASRVRHLNRILALLGVITFVELGAAVANLAVNLKAGYDAVLWVGVLCLCVGLFLACGCWRIYRKKCKLQKQQRLFE